MLASLLIVFREVLEAGLIVGIVMAATEGIRGRTAWIAGGVAVGAAAAAMLALFAGVLSNALSGTGMEVFNAVVLLLAVGMLAWHHLWMANHGRSLGVRLKAMGAQIGSGDKTLLAMAVVVAVAVLREEATPRWCCSCSASSPPARRPLPTPLLFGGLSGLALGAVVAFVIYRGLVAIPVKRLFAVTETLLTVLAAGLAAQAFAILAQIGAVPTLIDELWDTSWLLRDDSLLGRALHAMVGYADRPSGIQLLAWGVTLTAFMVGGHLVHSAGSTPAQGKRT